MIDKQSKEKINELVMTHLAFPVIVLLGLAITGIVIDSLLRINSTFGVLFIMVGGIPAIGSYYLSKFRKDSKT